MKESKKEGRKERNKERNKKERHKERKQEGRKILQQEGNNLDKEIYKLSNS